ncbi:hypothetical protein [Streptomyces sp. NPDC006355]|uniref:hypothetical protein n=1 Tax=Streptomyces sp. NPDC006355 TaxID=3156758 RepID=UPI0033B5339F
MTDLTPATAAILRYFDPGHGRLAPHLAAVSSLFYDLAHDLVDRVPDNDELRAGLRRLLEAKDCAVRAALDTPVPTTAAVEAPGGCPHCPDGYTPADGGSQPWHAWVGPERDGDGQPAVIHVARSAGAHVAESDAEWIRARLNGSGR